MGGSGTSPDLAPPVGVYSSSSKKKMRMMNAESSSSPSAHAQRSSTVIRFVPNVMLLEAAARNDVEEGQLRFGSQRFCSLNLNLNLPFVGHIIVHCDFISPLISEY